MQHTVKKTNSRSPVRNKGSNTIALVQHTLTISGKERAALPHEPDPCELAEDDTDVQVEQAEADQEHKAHVPEEGKSVGHPLRLHAHFLGRVHGLRGGEGHGGVDGGHN